MCTMISDCLNTCKGIKIVIKLYRKWMNLKWQRFIEILENIGKILVRVFFLNHDFIFRLKSTNNYLAHVHMSFYV